MLTRDDADAIAQLVRDQCAEILRRHRSLMRRVYITQTDDTGKVRTAQIQGIAGQVNDGVENLEQYGFSGNPPAAQPPECPEGIKIEIGGDPAHPIVICAFDRRDRPVNLKPGEAVMYNHWGDYAKCSSGGNFTVHAGAKVTIDAPDAEFKGNVVVDGSLNVSKTATFGSSVSFAAGNVTVAAPTKLLVVTAGNLKVNNIAVNAP